MRALVFVFGLVGCVGTADHEQTSHRTVDIDDPFHRVEIRSDAGGVYVSASGDPGDLDAILHWTEQRPELVWWLWDRTLFVEVRCPFDQGVCWADLDLSVPPHTVLDVVAQAGDVRVVDLEGAVALQVGAGDVWLERLAGPIEVDVAAGMVSGTALESASLSIDVDAGDVLTMHTVPFRQSVVRTRVGSIYQSIPAGRYACDLEAGVGTVDVSGIVDRPDAEHDLFARTSTGNITVRGYEPLE